jgi:hypothetical protein
MHCHSFRIVIPHALSLFTHCCSWCCSFYIAILMLFFLHRSSHVALFVLFLSCCNFALLFSHYSSSPIVAPLPLLFFSHYFSCPTVLLMLLFPSHCSFHIVVHFRYLLAHPLLFFLCCCCCFFRITTPFALLLYFACLIWYFPCPCHVEVEVQSFDTDSSIKSKFLCIFSIF